MKPTLKLFPLAMILALMLTLLGMPVTHAQAADAWQPVDVPGFSAAATYNTSLALGNGTWSINMDADKLAVASFAELPPSQYTLTINKTGNGSMVLTPAQVTYDAGTTVELTAVPDPGWMFSGWSDDLSGFANPASVTMNGNKIVTATFLEGGTVSFQESVAQYAGTVDTTIKYNSPNTSFGNQTYLEWDTQESTGSTPEIALLRFTNIFGSGAGQIPLGATITSATLRYRIYSNAGSYGNVASVYESLVGWDETTTYNTMGGDPGVQADEYSPTLVATASTGTINTEYTINVTASLQRWSSGTRPNYGWMFLSSGSDGVEIHSSETNIVSYRPVLTVTYSTSAPPDPPIVVQPLDGALDVSTLPTLEVAVTDRDSEPMDVTFYGRELNTTAPEDFTIIVLPDTQNYSDDNPDTYFPAQTQWIVAHKDELNIKYVVHEGDFVNDSTNTSYWTRADAAMDILDAANIPYGVVPGNHDEDGYYNDYFGVNRFCTSYPTGCKSFYGESYPAGDNQSSYTLFSASGMEFIVLNLDYVSPAPGLLNWADGVLAANSNRRAIVVSHSILDIDSNFSAWGSEVYNALKSHSNLFLMLSGHFHAEVRRTDVDAGTIHSLLADYQDYPNGGNGFLRILQFSPVNDEIRVKTYSPVLNAYETDANSQFVLPYEMDGNGPFANLGTVSNVASGSNVLLPWHGRDPNAQYEWYVKVSDGSRTTTGPIWDFTTTSTTCYTLTIGKNGNGAVPVANPVKSAACASDGLYTEGERISLIGASPDLGSHIAGWYGTVNNNSTASSNTLTMPARAESAGVNYEPDDSTLTVNIVPSGSGVVTRDDPGPYHYGDSVHLTAVANTGWRFVQWGGDLSGSDNPKSIILNGNKTVTATFVDETMPTVISIQRADADHTSAASVDFTVTFSEPVKDVGMNDFTLVNDTGGISGAVINNVTGSGATRTVTVDTGYGSGTLRLDVPINATITDLAGNLLGSLPFADGETYTINKDANPFTNCAAQTQIPAAECDALVALYNSTNGVHWTENTDWLQTDSPCSWFGITCSEGHVTWLNLEHNNLIGVIPPKLGNLTQLTDLHLGFNKLSGSIPPELGSLKDLVIIFLSANQLTGSIPPELGNLTNLLYLYLDNNQLSGSIPPQLGNLKNLTVLWLWKNNLTGSIPSELGNLTNTEMIWLHDNNLTSSIPGALGNLSGLTWLTLSNNGLTGSIPPELGNLTNLERLGLSGNSLTGSIPPEIGNLTSLLALGLNSNQLTGSIPMELGNMTNVEVLRLEGNRLTGEFPVSIVNLTKLTDFVFDCWITSTNPTVIAFINSVSPGWQNRICPIVSSITRANENPTSAASVDFTVTFSEPVKDVDLNDFTLVNSSGGISGAVINNVTGSDATRTVTVYTGYGNGTLRLDVPVTATIKDLADNPLGNLPFTEGQSYTIEKPVVGAGVYDDTDPAWTYMGAWASYSGPGPYNSSLHYTSTVGNSAQLTFTGTKFAVTFTKDSNRGSMDVFVDGNKVTTLNAYSASLAFQQSYTSPSYTDGTHTVRFVHAGGQPYIDIDAIRIYAAQVAVGVGTYDDNNNNWDYMGNWGTYSGGGPYANSLHYTSTVGDLAELTFTGVKFILTFTKDSNRGSIDVLVDGSKVTTINAYSASLAFQQTYTSPSFASGTHTLRLVHAGGSFIDIDAIQIVSAPVPVPAGTYDDEHAAWSYSGSWASYSGGGPSGNTLHYTAAVGDLAELTFTGAKFILTFTKDSNRGSIDVFVDGSKVTTLNAYSATLAFQQTYTSPSFASGTHTVRLVHAGGSFIDIDAIQILGEPVPVPVGAYDDAHTAWSYSGSWASYSGAGPSANTLHYTSTVGDLAELTFTGVKFILTFTRDANRGSIDVFVDGSKITTINAYSASLAFQQTYTSPSFAPGTHTVRLVHAGGSFIDIDAIQIVGTPVPVPVGTYDDAHTAWSYSGSWASYSGAGPSANTLHYTGTVGDSAELTFTGTKFALTFTKDSNRGSIDVYMDGSKVTTIDAYAASLTFQQTYTSPAYSPSTHTVRFVHAGGQPYIDIDAITILP